MRKMFRMKYEPCTGQCYAHSDVMRIHHLGLDVKGATAFLQRLLKIHQESCGNDQIQFRLDHEEVADRDVFVASFFHYGALDLFACSTPLDALNDMIYAALDYFNSDEYKTLAKAQPGKGHEVCHHGDDKKLIEFAINFSGLNDTEKNDLRAQFVV